MPCWWFDAGAVAQVFLIVGGKEVCGVRRRQAGFRVRGME